MKSNFALILLFVGTSCFSCLKEKVDSPTETAIEAIRGTYTGQTIFVEIINTEGIDSLTFTGNGIFTETRDTSFFTDLDLVISDPIQDSTIEVSYNDRAYEFAYNPAGTYTTSEQTGAYATRTFSMEVFGTGDSVMVQEFWQDTKANMAPADSRNYEFVGKR